jgi:hypothetical protein
MTEHLYAVLCADSEIITQTQLEQADDEQLTRCFVKTKAKSFVVRFGTYSEQVFELPLYPTSFKTGRTGYAGRARAVISKRVWHFRANLVRQDEQDSYGVTIAVKPPQQVSLAWAG